MRQLLNSLIETVGGYTVYVLAPITGLGSLALFIVTEV